MCDITNRTNRRVGYKVLALKDGKFYSTFTGQEIKVGKVPKAPEDIANPLSSNWNSDLEILPLKCCSFYKKKFNGKTGAFVNINDCKILANRIINHLYGGVEIVTVKIVFEGCVYSGTYKNYWLIDQLIIAGSKIKSIKIVKE